MGYLYDTSFDPSNPSASLLISSDNGGIRGGFRINYVLSSGRQYILVVTTSQASLTGDFWILARGPALARLTSIASPPTSKQYCFLFLLMDETNIASIVLGVVAGFYSTIFLLCLSDVVHLNKEMTKMKHELEDLRNQSIIFNRSSFVDSSNKILLTRTNISGKLCLSYDEQRQILEYINFICNMAILLFGSYSIYVHGIGTHHGLAYRLFFFICKLCTIIASIWLNLHFKKGLPSDIFLYIWIDINCVVSIYRSLRQII
ncbi:unnamed protein product [Rotaria sp. Silwood1]|nr:unnamed protein product [Rotaria sp. Silwood1]CAF3706272.1 unnamed protein product [Rotaria sp. Silwood1]CAF4685269.1 unnamed protein product [Rotaria sp. Silwood1]CAF4699088.1 unnamed protein product [Rotaria sp. Silwood1]